MNEFKMIRFEDDDFIVDVRADIENETIWLTQDEMTSLFEVSTDNIGLHIKNILKEKNQIVPTTEKCSVVQIEGKRKITRNIKIYNLDMIISVGYRVKSLRGIIFRKWANKVLKDYLIQGYSINKKKIEVHNKTISIQNKMLASTLNIDEEELVNVIDEYTKALDLLDDNDHQRITKPKGR